MSYFGLEILDFGNDIRALKMNTSKVCMNIYNNIKDKEGWKSNDKKKLQNILEGELFSFFLFFFEEVKKM